MKIRTGFVSNSSSSSFIIAFPKGTTLNVQNLAGIVFPGIEDVSEHVISAYGDGVNGIAALEAIVRDTREFAKDQAEFAAKKATGEATDEDWDYDEKNDPIGDALGGTLYRDGVPERLRYLLDERPNLDYHRRNETPDEWRERWDDYAAKSYAWEQKFKEALVAHFGDSDIYVVEYSDNDGNFGSTMEHGGVFDAMIADGTAVRISNH